MCEALGKYGFDFAASVLVSTFTALNIVEHADAAQKDAFIGPFMEGRLRTEGDLMAMSVLTQYLPGGTASAGGLPPGRKMGRLRSADSPALQQLIGRRDSLRKASD